MENSSKDVADYSNGLKAKIDFLKSPGAYPEPTSTVEVKETHMSLLFLTDKYVYKLKKSRKYSFLDFTTLNLRRINCEKEFSLNKRLAQDIYLGVVPLSENSSGQYQLEQPGETVDWLVKMKRLPADKMLDVLIKKEQVNDIDLKAFVDVLNCFYQNCQHVDISEKDYLLRLEAQINTTCEELRELSPPPNPIKMIQQKQVRILYKKASLFHKRVKAKKIVDGHGDLRPEHVCLIHPPVVFDCLEFNDDLSILDTGEELAFLELECETVNPNWESRKIIEMYRQISQDDLSDDLVNFYKSKRALLRASLAIRHIIDPYFATDGKFLKQYEHYCEMAKNYLELIN